MHSTRVEVVVKRAFWLKGVRFVLRSTIAQRLDQLLTVAYISILFALLNHISVHHLRTLHLGHVLLPCLLDLIRLDILDFSPVASVTHLSEINCLLDAPLALSFRRLFLQLLEKLYLVLSVHFGEGLRAPLLCLVELLAHLFDLLAVLDVVLALLLEPTLTLDRLYPQVSRHLSFRLFVHFSGQVLVDFHLAEARQVCLI